jgi:hypothetical protein
MGLLLDQDRLVAPLEDMTDPLMDPVEPLRIDAVELAHALGLIAVRRLDQEMTMVGDQAVGVDDPVEPFPHTRQHVEKRRPVAVAPERSLRARHRVK